MNLAATKVDSVTVGATRTQKAKVGQLAVDGLTDHWAGCPHRLHVVVVPGFATVKPKSSGLIDQHVMAQSIAGWMSQNSQAPCGVYRLNHRVSP